MEALVAGDSILVVDDNDMNLRLLRWLLEKNGYEVHTAGDARTARASIRAVHPRLVLMDIQLPDVNGLQLTREFKADPELRDIPIVAVTSYAMKGDQQKTIDAGATGTSSSRLTRSCSRWRSPSICAGTGGPRRNERSGGEGAKARGVSFSMSRGPMVVP